jgi:hypothetical protein
MDAAGLTDVTVEPEVWHAAWPEPEAAWRSAMQGPLSGPLLSLDPSSLGRVREAFVSQLRGLAHRHVDDLQQLLVGVGTAPPASGPSSELPARSGHREENVGG